MELLIIFVMVIVFILMFNSFIRLHWFEKLVKKEIEQQNLNESIIDWEVLKHCYDHGLTPKDTVRHLKGLKKWIY